jgi:hypothetical protein
MNRGMIYPPVDLPVSQQSTACAAGGKGTVSLFFAYPVEADDVVARVLI